MFDWLKLLHWNRRDEIVRFDRLDALRMRIPGRPGPATEQRA